MIRTSENECKEGREKVLIHIVSQAPFTIALISHSSSVQFSSVTQSCLTLCNPWIAACQASVALQQNQIGMLSPGLFHNNRNLQKLYLSNNHISQLPPGIFLHLPQLNRLTLFGNSLKELSPGIFGPMHNLRELWLYDNQLHARYTDWLSVCLPYAGRRG